MAKYYTDQERYEYVRKWKLSGLTVSEYARENGLCRSTFRDWVHAYRNIRGKFINVNTVSQNPNNIIENKDYRVNILNEVEKKKRRNHFDRFDHSVVEIEYKEIKITTSLEQAEILLKELYDNVQGE